MTRVKYSCVVCNSCSILCACRANIYVRTSRTSLILSNILIALYRFITRGAGIVSGERVSEIAYMTIISYPIIIKRSYPYLTTSKDLLSSRLIFKDYVVVAGKRKKVEIFVYRSIIAVNPHIISTN